MTHDSFDPTGDLAPQDQRLVDALVECGFDADALEALPESERPRLEAVTSLFELLEDYPVEDADETLVHATLARIVRHEDERASRMAFAHAAVEAETGPRRRFRLPDFISLAAVILIGTSVVWPVASHLRQRSIDMGCEGNLRNLAVAFHQYSSDFNGAMPIAQAGLHNAWSRGNHNVVNLGPLVQNGYCDVGHFNCPGHVGQFGESYSYQWQVPGRLPRWGVGRITLVLGDRNPIVDAARMGQVIPPLSISINHGGRGQNALESDGVIRWLVQPLYRGRDNDRLRDNIWLPGRVDFLRDGDTLADPGDVFLAH